MTYSHTLKGGDSFESLPNRLLNCAINNDAYEPLRLSSSPAMDNALPTPVAGNFGETESTATVPVERLTTTMVDLTPTHR